MLVAPLGSSSVVLKVNWKAAQLDVYTVNMTVDWRDKCLVYAMDFWKAKLQVDMKEKLLDHK